MPIMLAVGTSLVLLVATASSDPLTWLVNFGVAGIVIVLFVTGQIRTKAEVENLKSDIAAKDELIKAFQAQLMGHTLPALERSAQVLEAIPSSERSLYSQLTRAQQEVAALSDRLSELAKGPNNGSR